MYQSDFKLTIMWDRFSFWPSHPEIIEIKYIGFAITSKYINFITTVHRQTPASETSDEAMFPALRATESMCHYHVLGAKK